MRDPNRIKPFMEKFAELWEECAPDMRFGQIISNMSKQEDSFYQKNIFYMEDEEFLVYLEDFLCKMNTIKVMEKRND